MVHVAMQSGRTISLWIKNFNKCVRRTLCEMHGLASPARFVRIFIYSVPIVIPPYRSHSWFAFVFALTLALTQLFFFVRLCALPFGLAFLPCAVYSLLVLLPMLLYVLEGARARCEFDRERERQAIKLCVWVCVFVEKDNITSWCALDAHASSIARMAHVNLAVLQVYKCSFYVYISVHLQMALATAFDIKHFFNIFIPKTALVRSFASFFFFFFFTVINVVHALFILVFSLSLV